MSNPNRPLNDPNGFSYFNGKWILLPEFSFGALSRIEVLGTIWKVMIFVHFKETGLAFYQTHLRQPWSSVWPCNSTTNLLLH